jgi:hypothetical protein
MTKQVRIENADTSSARVIVQVWDKATGTNPDGSPDGKPDTLVKEVNLDYPTAMSYDLYLTDTRYLVVKEAKPHVVEPTKAPA